MLYDHCNFYLLLNIFGEYFALVCFQISLNKVFMKAIFDEKKVMESITF